MKVAYAMHYVKNYLHFITHLYYIAEKVVILVKEELMIQNLD